MFSNSRPMQKVILRNSTRMSLHERFTFLRNNAVGDVTTTGNNAVQRQRELYQQMARNKRIAMQMERRPAVMAALKLKKKSLRQRLGVTGNNGSGIGNRLGTSIKDRLTLGNRGKGLLGRGGRIQNRLTLNQQNVRIGRLRGRGLSNNAGGGRGRLSRSQSMQSLNNAGGNFQNRSRSRSRVRTNSISANNNSNNVNRFRNRGQRGTGNLRFNQQKPRGRRGALNTSFRGNGGNWGTGRGRLNRGRGGGIRGRGRGRGINGRRQQNTPVPTKEELDNQLDQYMAGSRFNLDQDLDSYMKQATNSATTSSATPMEESWD